MRILLILVIAYLIGSIPSGYLIVRAKEGEDVRESGSGGTGATNVSRRAGKGAGILTLVLDVIKGMFAVFIAGLLSDGLFPSKDWTIAFAGMFAILGHIFPVWLRFRGGKGVATALGVFLMLEPIAVVVALALFAATFVITRYVSLASIVAISAIAITVLALTIFDPLELPNAIAALLSAGLVVFAHRANVQRLQAGTEPKFQ
ncbi:MAG TPA: glycerol-3-phosphate 1-O-acyltransferase PlsY [Pyrinomonadaceae bacterium]|nr:glycerol-3-phosphate 1-O-acyltransferase PlsY [Pyrinomonadaceae bacterium]